jgi:hypothetical protein
MIAEAERGKYRWLWAGPLIFALWVNAHGGFLAGLGFLGIWAFIHLILHRSEWHRIIPPVVLSFLAVLINPYGLDLITFLLRTATLPRPEILEWRPLPLVSSLGAIYLVLLIITILGMVFSQREKRTPILVLLVIAAILPFVAVRHLPLFSLAVLVFAGEHIANAWAQMSKSSRSTTQKPNWMVILSILASIGLLLWGFTNFIEITLPNKPEPFFPDKSVALLKESKVQGNLAVEFNWGEYVIWHLGPGVQISEDGRRETVYSDEIYKTNFSFFNGINDWHALIDDYATNMALITRNGPAYNLMESKSGWELIYEDSTSALFASQEWDQIKVIREHADSFEFPPSKSVFP